jgi:RHS repeat-associated protein
MVGSTPTRFRHILFDNNGNATTKNDSTGITTYAWDFENLMTSVALPASGGTLSFRYDPFGRRIYKSSSSGTSIFAYDGDNLVEETNSSGAAIARYSQGLNIDEPLAMLRSSTISFYQADGLGSVTSLSNAAGALAQIYTFDSFGKQTATSGSIVNSFQYTGRESDSETGLYYYRARYYDPVAVRFISEDLSGFGAAQIFINTRTIIQLLMPIRLARCPDPRLFTICINAFGPRRSAVHRRCLAIVAFRNAFLPSRVIESGCDGEKLPLEVETADFQGGHFTDAGRRLRQRET